MSRPECEKDNGLLHVKLVQDKASVTGESGMPYEMTLREGPLSVLILGDIPVTHTVFWANHRIACLEPYNRLRLAPGETARWTVRYRINL